MPSKIKALGNNKYKFTFLLREDESGKQIYKSKTVEGIASEQEAYIQYATMAEKIQQEPISKYKNNLTLTQFIDRWFRDYVQIACATTTRDYYCRMRVRVDEALGHLAVNKIKTVHLNKFTNALLCERNRNTGKPLSKLTVQKYQKFLQTVFKAAVRAHVISFNPAEEMSMVTVMKTAKEIPDDDEMSKIFTIIDNDTLQHRALFLLFLVSGMRRSELNALRWDDIHWEDKYLDVKKARVKSIETISEVKTPKSTAGYRTIALSTDCLELLKELKQLNDSREADFAAKEGYNPANTGYVFVNLDTGKPLHPDTLTKIVEKICRKAGVKIYTPHLLRHWCCSNLIDQGVSIKDTQMILGHSDSKTTLNVYAHSLRKPKTSAAKAIADKLAEIKKL